MVNNVRGYPSENGRTCPTKYFKQALVDYCAIVPSCGAAGMIGDDGDH